MCNSYDAIEIDNYIILSTLQNFHFGEHFIFGYTFGLKHAEPNFIIKRFKTNIILFTKYLNLYWYLVESFSFFHKMIDLN